MFEDSDGSDAPDARTRIIRVGDTVRRPAGPWTPTAHALLRHLEAGGFTAAPRALGMDEEGREILSYIEGEPAMRPWPPRLRDDGGLRALARLVREYHEAVYDFEPPPGSLCHVGPVELQPGQIMCHGDLGPWNTIWRDGHPVALIDWDSIEPGLAITDVAQAAGEAVPLRGDAIEREAGFRTKVNIQMRLNIFCEGYGRYDPRDVLDVLDEVQTRDRQRISELGAQGIEPWATWRARGDVERIEQEQAWLKTQRALFW